MTSPVLNVTVVEDRPIRVTLGVTKTILTQVGGQGPSGPRGQAATAWFSFGFPVPKETWLVQHNLGVRRFVFVVRDQVGHPQVAGHRIVDDNSFEITFSEPLAGSVDVCFEG